MAECPSVPRKRPDRTAKLKARKEQQETVVKSSIRRYVVCRDKDIIVSALQQRVAAYSKRVCLASVALAGIVKDAFRDADDVLTVDIPDVFEQTFIRQLMLGTADAVDPSPIVGNYHARHPELLATLDRHQGDRNIYSAGATTFLTNLKNSLTVNMEKRVKQLAKDLAEVHDLDDGERVSVVYDILGWTRNAAAHGFVYPQRRVIWEAVERHRMVLGLADGECVSKMWLKTVANLKPMLRHAVELNRFKQLHGLATTFNVTPICKVRSHFITVDTSTLYGMLKELRMVGGNIGAFNVLADDHWRSIFAIDRLAGQFNTFTGTIQTDGTALCTHFTRPKNAQDGGAPHPRDVSSREYRHIAIDPGRENIYFAVEDVGDAFETWRLTRAQYYAEAGINGATRRTQTWSKGIQAQLVVLSRATSKGVDMAMHDRYVRSFVQTFDAVWDEYSKPRWARQRLRLYGGKKRVFARFFNTIEQFDVSRRVTVGYGSAKFAPGGRNEVAVPTSRAFKECSQRFPTSAIDEFRTTMVHHEDDSVLQKVAIRRTGNVSRGLLWCCSTGNSKFVNRDKNAAINILRCFTLPQRPLALTRRPNLARIRHVVGKTICC